MVQKVSATARRPPSEPVRSLGRPRSARTDQAILAATLTLLAEGLTPEALTLDLVAARARASKATIYRRWGDKHGLLRAALHGIEHQPPTPPIAGVACAHDELVGTLQHIQDWLRHSLEGRIVPQLIGEMRRNPALVRDFLMRFLRGERIRLRQVLDRGVANGEFRTDLDTDLFSRIFFNLLMEDVCCFQDADAPIPGRWDRIVHELVRGLRPGGGVSPG